MGLAVPAKVLPSNMCSSLLHFNTHCCSGFSHQMCSLFWGLMKVADVLAINHKTAGHVHCFLAVNVMTTSFGRVRQLLEEPPSIAVSLGRCDAPAATWGGCNALEKGGVTGRRGEEAEGGRQGLLPGDEGRKDREEREGAERTENEEVVEEEEE